jgi:hypothetical protein
MGTKIKTQTNDTTIQLYELEKVRFIIKDACGLDIAYAYEDLVFSEHGIFILQFSKESSSQVTCWFNKDCLETNKAEMVKLLSKSATLNGLKIIPKGKFEMKQKEGSDEIDIQFIVE